RTIDMGAANTGAEGPGFSPDGQRVFAGHPFMGVKVYEVATGVLVSHVPNTPSIRVAPDGQTFLGQPDRGCDSRGPRWATFSFPTGQVLDEFMTHTGSVSNLDVSSDGARIATAGSDTFSRVWDAATTERLQAFNYGCVSSALDEVAFSPDGATLAGAGLCW